MFLKLNNKHFLFTTQPFIAVELVKKAKQYSKQAV